MKKSVLLVTLLMLISCVCGCNGKKNDSVSESSMPEIMKKLEMPDVDISVPADYESSSTDSNETVFVKNDASIIINSDEFTEQYKTLDEYVDFAIETYKAYTDETEILVNDKISANGCDGRMLEYTYKLNTGNGIFSKYCMTAFFSDSDQIYLVTCKSDVDTYENYHSEFLSIVNSFGLAEDK